MGCFIIFEKRETFADLTRDGMIRIDENIQLDPTYDVSSCAGRRPLLYCASFLLSCASFLLFLAYKAESRGPPDRFETIAQTLG
jgi:hypothetical protein